VRLVAKILICPLIKTSNFFPKLQRDSQHGSLKQNAFRRSVKDSVLKLDALSTGVACYYDNGMFFILSAVKHGISVVFGLQNYVHITVVGLQMPVLAAKNSRCAPNWCAAMTGSGGSAAKYANGIEISQTKFVL
jgi:hypothetical protein